MTHHIAGSCLKSTLFRTEFTCTNSSFPSYYTCTIITYNATNKDAITKEKIIDQKFNTSVEDKSVPKKINSSNKRSNFPSNIFIQSHFIFFIYSCLNYINSFP